jgi:hypothetical protein
MLQQIGPIEMHEKPSAREMMLSPYPNQVDQTVPVLRFTITDSRIMTTSSIMSINNVWTGAKLGSRPGHVEKFHQSTRGAGEAEEACPK